MKKLLSVFSKKDKPTEEKKEPAA
jgi:hypothetical protein